jgi:murein L,D-transpeptidase YafK
VGGFLGHDLFEARHVPPVVSVCNGRYAFEPGSTETVGRAVEERCPPEVAGN